MNNKIIILLSPGLILFFFNGCMTMGWGSHYNNSSSQPTDQQVNLIKEQQEENQTFRATFPSAAAGQQVHFELETISQDTTNTPIESVVLKMQNPENSGSTLSSTTIKPDPTLSRQGHWIFPYSFHEPGPYEIAFRMQFNDHKQSSSHLIISDFRQVSEPVAVYNSFTPLPWMAGGVIMTGFMIWMMAY